ncbi:MAG TPA: mannosyl-3-phosphoglycerate phosphatase, partial [Rhodobacterales bacterium]|nr:mannosyl-3-phosphoglycerate phosphatase [Rhodobacterales bacterium]
MSDAAPPFSRLVVFTDLDGTLLDHDSYSWAPARPALDALKAGGAALVLASSKTAPEIADLHAALGLGDTPAIVENGAGVYRPGQGVSGAGDYARLRAALDALEGDLRSYFQGFGDMSDAQVAAETGLASEDATRARVRAYSEPGLWHGSDAQLAAFGAQPKRSEEH